MDNPQRAERSDGEVGGTSILLRLSPAQWVDQCDRVTFGEGRGGASRLCRRWRVRGDVSPTSFAYRLIRWGLSILGHSALDTSCRRFTHHSFSRCYRRMFGGVPILLLKEEAKADGAVAERRGIAAAIRHSAVPSIAAPATTPKHTERA